MKKLYVSPPYLVISDWQLRYRSNILVTDEYRVIKVDFLHKEDVINWYDKFEKDLEIPRNVIRMGYLQFFSLLLVNAWERLSKRSVGNVGKA